jgi:hypothetical protein
MSTSVPNLFALPLLLYILGCVAEAHFRGACNWLRAGGVDFVAAAAALPARPHVRHLGVETGE